MRLLVLLVSMALSPVALSAQVWTGYGDVDHLRVWNGESILGYFVNETLPCGSGKNYQIKPDLPLQDTIVSILLTAQTTGKKVKLLYQEGECTENGNTYIYGVRLVN